MFDNSLDFSLLCNFILGLLMHFLLLNNGLLQECLLLLSIHLCLHILGLPQLLFHQTLMMLIQFPCLPQSHLQCRLVGIHFRADCTLEHTLLDGLIGFVCWSEVRDIQVCFFMVLVYFRVEFGRLSVVFDGDEQMLLVKFNCFELRAGLKFLSIFVS